MEDSADGVDGRVVAGAGDEDVEDAVEKSGEVLNYGGQLGGVEGLFVENGREF